MKPKKKPASKRLPALKPSSKALLPVCEECGRSAPVDVRKGLCIDCHMEDNFFATWWRREGSRLLVAGKSAPSLDDYVRAAFKAGYHKRTSIEETIKKLRSRYNGTTNTSKA